MSCQFLLYEQYRKDDLFILDDKGKPRHLNEATTIVASHKGSTTTTSITLVTLVAALLSAIIAIITVISFVRSK